MTALALTLPLLFAHTDGLSRVAVDTVDVIEVNHFYAENGRHVFDQVIYWEWIGRESRYHVRGWRMLKGDRQRPSRCKTGWRAIWLDEPTMRKVVSFSPGLEF